LVSMRTDEKKIKRKRKWFVEGEVGVDRFS
jgi:hypothetical protein